MLRAGTIAVVACLAGAALGAPAQDMTADRLEKARTRYRAAKDRAQKDAAGGVLVNLLVAMGDRATRQGEWPAAADAYTEAGSIAAALKLASRDDITQKLRRAMFFKEAQQKAAGYVKVLQASPENTTVRTNLLTVLVVDLDDPKQAVPYATPEAGNVWATYVPLAARPVNEQAGPACKELGDWYYKELLPTASSPYARANVLARALAYYRRFAEQKPGDPTEEMVAKVSVRLIESELAKLGETINPKPPYPEDAVAFGGHHYKAIRNRMTWQEAKAACEKMGGHLACLETVEEVEFAKKLAGSARLWVGCSDEAKEGEWRWLSGSPVDRQPVFWQRGEPTGNKGENFGSIVAAGLRDTRIDHQEVAGFVCEWDN